MLQIESLTDEQIKKIPEFIDKWVKIGLCTDPANRKDAEDGINLVYEAAGLKKPEKIVWCGSPLSQALTRAFVLNPSVEQSVQKSVRKSMWKDVMQSVWESVRKSVRKSVMFKDVWQVGRSMWKDVVQSVEQGVRQRVRKRVGRSAREIVFGSMEQIVVQRRVWESVRKGMWESVWKSWMQSVEQGACEIVGQKSVWKSVWESDGDSFYGQHDADWLAFYDFFNQVCELKDETRKLDGFLKIAKNSGWWLPHEKICWVSERHNSLHLDERGRLHNPNKAALTYPDGWPLYYWHGVSIPKKYILTSADKIDLSEALKETNSSVRMAVIQKVGFLRLKSQIPNKLISKTDSADLLEFKLGGLNVRGLHVKWKDKFNTSLETIIPVPNSKEKFGEDCPDDINDAEQVRRWTLLTGKQDEFVVET